MNYVRHVLTLFFIALTVMCVSYAHSQQKALSQKEGVVIYSSNNLFLSNCSLKVEREGGTVYFVPQTETKTRFAGFWPDQAGSLEIPAVTYPRVNFDGETVAVTESITIHFQRVNGQIEPVSYTYSEERRGSRKSMLMPVTCVGLGRDQ